MDKNHARATKTSIRGMKSTLTTDPSPSTNFNINELESDLKSVKLGRLLVLEFIRNCGERMKEWLISFMNNVLSSARLPKLFKLLARLSLFKNHFVAEYKLTERLIVQRIQPLIEAATPVHQAGFHKHR
jgi:hypothetical protein